MARPAKKGKKSKQVATQEKTPQIYLCTPIPALSERWNIRDSVIVSDIIPIQQEVARKYGLNVIDLHTLFAGEKEKMLSDGIHPDGKGAHRMAEIIAEKIR